MNKREGTWILEHVWWRVDLERWDDLFSAPAHPTLAYLNLRHLKHILKEESAKIVKRVSANEYSCTQEPK